jgi:acyl carrier protein
MNEGSKIDDRIKQIIAAVLSRDIEEIHDDASPDTLSNWDSLRHMNIVLALEEEFGVHFDEQRLLELTSFALLREELRKHAVGS